MAGKTHTYQAELAWTGAAAEPARTYQGYSRDHVIKIPGKPDLLGSADPGFLGDAARHNPEDLLVASLAACHMLWFLHLCTVNGICVHGYEDRACGCMEETSDGGGRFTQVVLNPEVVITPGDKLDLAIGLHAQAHKKCFIANSVNFPVLHNPKVTVARD